MSGEGLAKLRAAIQSLDGLTAKVGWWETSHYEDGTSVAYVASIHEFGYAEGGIPARPFMRPTIDEQSQNWTDQMTKGARSVLAGKLTGRQALERVAMGAAGNVAETISNVSSPPLAEATQARKGHSKPLLDTGLLIQSLAGAVEE